MSWWVLELITFGGLVLAVVTLGPLIKRFGRSYAADVFRANPRTGKSYIVLMDMAYYLIFSAYILFTTVACFSSWAFSMSHCSSRCRSSAWSTAQTCEELGSPRARPATTMSPPRSIGESP